MAPHRPLRTPNDRSGRRARERAVIRVHRTTALIGLTAVASAAGLGVLVASDTAVPSSASAADRATGSSTATEAGRTTATTTTSPASAASTNGDASAGTTSTSDPTMTTTTSVPETHTVSGQT